MKPSENCTQVVQAWEGVKDGNTATVNLDPYIDPVGIVTIGYGHAIVDPASGAYFRGVSGLKKASALYPVGLTPDQASDLLLKDMTEASNALKPPRVRAGTTQAQFDALVCFCFNVGAGAYDKSSLRRLHEAQVPALDMPGDDALIALYRSVAARTLKPATPLEGFAVYSRAGGTFLLGLFCRRISEYALYLGYDGLAAVAAGTQARQLIQSLRR